MTKINNFPLVSVIAVTYNSSAYILETLESIKNQTYSNLEIIITDDCSTDITISTINNWLESNKKIKNSYCSFIKNRYNSEIICNMEVGLNPTLPSQRYF